jgi:hypothetical protein
MNLKQPLRFGVLVAVLLLPIVVQAQAPTPSPSPSPSPARSLSENIAALTQRAASLLPQFDNEVVSQLIGWFELLAWIVGNCLAGFAMLRIMREDNGEGSNLYWWFGRLGLFFLLSGTSLAIINGMSVSDTKSPTEMKTGSNQFCSNFISLSVTASTSPMPNSSRICSR